MLSTTTCDAAISGTSPVCVLLILQSLTIFE
jgi:hypothetical protein